MEPLKTTDELSVEQARRQNKMGQREKQNRKYQSVFYVAICVYIYIYIYIYIEREREREREREKVVGGDYFP